MAWRRLNIIGGKAHAIWPLEEYEMLERVSGERREADHERGWMIARGNGKVWPIEVRRATDGNKEVIDEHKVPHFLDGNAYNDLTPAVDGYGFLVREAITLGGLEAERRIDISA